MSLVPNVPTYIHQTIADAPKQMITAERWNQLWNLVVTQGDNTAKLLYDLIVALSAATASTELGASVASVPQKNVQAILTEFETRLADRYTKQQTDANISAASAGDFVSVSLNSSTGDMTFTKTNGETSVINVLTIIEHIPTDVLFDQRYYTKAILDPILTEATTAANSAKSVAESNFVPMKESDDVSICSGTATLSAGWTYVPFPRLFRATPIVVCNVLDALDSTVIIKQINESGFYAALVKTNVPPSVNVSINKTMANNGTTFYLSQANNWTNVIGPFTVVSDVSGSGSASQGATQFLAGAIHYVACLDDGVRL